MKNKKMKMHNRIETIQGGGYEAKINVSRGANCICLRHKMYGANILREPDYETDFSNPYLYGMPILFPVNRISGGGFSFEGRRYTFPINEPATGCHLHGVLHETAFSVIEKTQSKIVCLYRADADKPYLSFPHAFQIKITYELGEDGFLQTTEVTNLSSHNMPLMLGFHTTFVSQFAGKSNDIHVRVSLSEEYERNMKNYLPTGNKPSFDAVTNTLLDGTFSPLGTPISRHYRAGNTGKMVLYDGAHDLSVVYENDEKLAFRLIYNGNADEYICLEPQTCLANCPNAPFARSEAGFDFVAPDTSKVYQSKISIQKGDKR